ncbi:hypothetical protein [Alicyclobacillus ferrooxydans]|uniref:Uncharacterized protein n=1 Tax=Alicyclobacillus ferrooxydans TaxID=471514 RepID=A0A0P9CEM0_9BACL|nr:hypothetical protein [Alicyclobacillus ferrooxydans]KPV44252.1 hypothetical protein AN477_08115 [Alicyclobacillus ferrooxydans]
MHRTDPWYVAIVIVFALALLTILLRRVRATLPGDRAQSAIQNPPNDYHTTSATEDNSRDMQRPDN